MGKSKLKSVVHTRRSFLQSYGYARRKQGFARQVRLCHHENDTYGWPTVEGNGRKGLLIHHNKVTFIKEDRKIQASCQINMISLLRPVFWETALGCTRAWTTIFGSSPWPESFCNGSLIFLFHIACLDSLYGPILENHTISIWLATVF